MFKPFLIIKKYFSRLLDYFSTSLFDNKNNEQREISDTLSSVRSEQLEGGTGEVSFNSCPAHHILAWQATKILFKWAQSNSFLPFKMKKSKKGSYQNTKSIQRHLELMCSLYNAVVYMNSSNFQYCLTFSRYAPTSSLLFIDL